MEEALKEARKAFSEDEVPVGAVIVHKGRIIARGHNQVELLKDSTAHAEIICVTQASAYLDSKWLSGCSMYVTIEPCSMCAGALVLARITSLIYGAADPKAGGCGSVFDITHSNRLNHRIEVKKGILAGECAALLSDFFKRKRAQKDREGKMGSGEGYLGYSLT
jgi:tRNA(adenine34) deaminase